MPPVRPVPGAARNWGRPSVARLIFIATPSIRMPCTSRTNSAGRASRHHLEERALGIGVGRHDAGVNLLAACNDHTTRTAVAKENLRHFRMRADLRPKPAGAIG